MIIKNYISLLKNSGIYSFGAILYKGIGFFLIPIYTAVLLPSDYGRLEVIITACNFVTIFANIGLPQVIFIEYLQIKITEKNEFISSIISTYIYIGIPVFSLSFVLIKYFLNMDSSQLLVLIIAITTSFVVFFQTIYINISKLEQKTIEVTLIQLYLGFGTAVLNIIFVYYLRIGIIGIVLSNFLITTSFVCFLYFKYFSNFRLLNISRVFSLSKPLLKLGLPFVPSSIALWGINGMDRLILLKNSGDHLVGIYSISYKFSVLVQFLIITPFMDAYLPFIFRRFKDKIMEQNITIISVFILGVFLIIGFIIKYIATFMIDPNYEESLVYIPFIIFSMGIYFINQIIISKILFFKKTYSLVLIMIIIAILNVGLNLILIPKLAIYGIIVASILANILGTTLYSFYSKRYEKQFI